MRWIGLALAAISIVGCRATPPEIARKLPSSYTEGERVFDARLKQRFPVGTKADDVATDLRQQGFSVQSDGDGGHATFSDKAPIVQSVWNVGWKSNGGQITEVWGIYGGRGP